MDGRPPQVQDARTYNEVISFLRDGHRPVDVPAALMAEGVSEHHVEIMRGELAKIIYEAGRHNVEYLFGDSISSLEQTERGVDVTLRHGAARTFDLVVGADGLHSITRHLTFAHRLRGVTVDREYSGDVPMIDAYAGELNQVWTNVIDNAVDAMSGSGTLRVTTRVEADDVVIEIADTGVGMSPEVAARAFEAFYTTKDVGQGTGLGLDIARRIVVERHGGSIMIDSRPVETPEKTIVRVCLPTQRITPGR